MDVESGAKYLKDLVDLGDGVVLVSLDRHLAERAVVDLLVLLVGLYHGAGLYVLLGDGDLCDDLARVGLLDECAEKLVVYHNVHLRVDALI